MTRIAIAGCAGRMGKTLLNAAHTTPEVALTGGSVLADSPLVGVDLALIAGMTGNLGIASVTDVAALYADADAVIDFTTPELTLELAEYAALHHKVLVTGTTGLTPAQQQQLELAATRTPIVQSFNMSLGVNILAALVERTAAMLDEDFDIEILEMHHRHKVDAPSGTALMLGQAAAAGRKVTLDDKARYSREGHTGARPTGEIGFATLRGGGVIGDHTVMFADENERIELTHKSSSRAIYAKGALKAAGWAVGKPAGLYSMRDVLGLA